MGYSLAFASIRGVNFNTSHVSINRMRPDAIQNKGGISIHLMFLLIMIPVLQKHQWRPISIHLMFPLIAQRGEDRPVKEKFQYISCFY